MASSESHVALSDRELQVLDLVAAGLTNEQIADQLAISKRTVDNHISNILTKSETNNRVALVRWALQWGKVCIDDVNCCPLPPPATPSAGVSPAVSAVPVPAAPKSKPSSL
jgi:DNA-binding CsgD family transcriptional regulator